MDNLWLAIVRVFQACSMRRVLQPSVLQLVPHFHFQGRVKPRCKEKSVSMFTSIDGSQRP